MRLLLAVVLGMLGGCGGEDDRPATWSYIHAAIIEPGCATISCHSNANAQAGLRLHSPEAAYAILVGRACGSPTTDEQAPFNYVVPGEPNRSRLMHLLLGENVRLAMPPDRLLPLPDVELIETWILEGAPCN